MKNFFGSYVFQPQNFKIEHEESENLKAVSVVISEQNGIQLDSVEIDDISKKWETFQGWYFSDYEDDDRNVIQAQKEH